jgi:GT2 family glycosyltransferase
MPTISFVIPTFSRAPILAQCLRALDAQESAPVEYEVVVVDDGSTDDTGMVMNGIVPGLSVPVRLLHQQNQGAATARNLGVTAARGNLIGFLGDDIVVERSYVRNIYGGYLEHEGEPHGVLGHTRYRADSIPTPFGRWLDTKSGFQFDYSEARVDAPLPFELFYASNILVPRAALEQAGGFDTRLRVAAYEDAELGYRLSRQGLTLYFCPEARAEHIHRVSITSAAARMRMLGQSLNDLRHINSELFDTLYPEANGVFGHPSATRRVGRWLFSNPVARVVEFLDRGGVEVPGDVYARILRSTFSREMSTLWPRTGVTIDGT